MPLFLLFGIISIVIYEEASSGRKVAQISMTSDQEKEQLKEQITCAFDEIFKIDVFYTRNLKNKSNLSLDFLYKRLSEGFAYHKIASPIEKTHFFAQVFSETEKLLWTVEKTYARRWRNVLRKTTGNVWNCNEYLNAINGDKNYFDNNYYYSRNSYKAKFRGRGLIQLTHCHNYLNFFYNQAAVKANKLALIKDLLKDRFHFRNKNGFIVELDDKEFCKDEILENLVDFETDGLNAEPQAIITDFEDTANELSLPCNGRDFSAMSSLEFLIDSSLNYWKKCREGNFKNYINDSSAKGFVMMSQCIMGSPGGSLRTFRPSYCSPRYKNRPDREGNSNWTLISDEGITNVQRNWHNYLKKYCKRLQSFNALQVCFKI